MNVIVEPVMGYLDHITVARFYRVLRPVAGKVDLCL